MGETLWNWPSRWATVSFSILKRIVMGETKRQPEGAAGIAGFQYPQADRDG